MRFLLQLWALSTLYLSVVQAEDVVLCHIPEASEYADPNPVDQCSGSAVSFEEAVRRAWEFAPVMHFHKLESFYPQSVATYLRGAHLYDEEQNDLGPVTEEKLLKNAMQNGNFYVSIMGDGIHPRSDNFDWSNNITGAPFTNGNVSTAEVYFTVKETNGTFVYQYWTYYAYNGCSNQEVYYQDRSEVDRYLEYEACNMGVHEGDWEAITVQVCTDLNTTLRMAYSQHAWYQYYNCIENECVFSDRLGKGATNPEVWVALNSHAQYAVNARNIVYMQNADVNDIVSNVFAFDLADRTWAGNKYWIPQPDNRNLVWLDQWQGNTSDYDAATISQHVNLTRNNTDEWSTPSWIAWKGRWGLSYGESAPLEEIECFYNDFEYLSSCPENGIFTVISVFLGITNADWLDGLFNAVEDLISVSGLLWLDSGGSGSLTTKNVFGVYPTGDGLPPGLSNGAIVQCPDPLNFQAGFPSEFEFDAAASDLTYSITVLSVLVGILILFILFIHVLRWKHPESKKAYTIVDEKTPKQKYKYRSEEKQSDSDLDEETSNDKPDKEEHEDSEEESEELTQCERYLYDVAWSLPRLSIVGAAFAVTGMFLIEEEADRCLEVLAYYLSFTSFAWNDFREYMSWFLPVLLACDSLSLATSFFVTGKTFQYCVTSRTRSSARCIIWTGWVTQCIAVMFIFACGFLSMLIFAAGVLLWALDFLLLFACEEITDYQDTFSGICLDLSSIGMEQVLCGEDYEAFCNAWNSLNPQVIASGTIILVTGQAIFVLAAGMNFAQYYRKGIKASDIRAMVLERRNTTDMQIHLGMVFEDEGIGLDKHINMDVNLKFDPELDQATSATAEFTDPAAIGLDEDVTHASLSRDPRSPTGKGAFQFKQNKKEEANPCGKRKSSIEKLFKCKDKIVLVPAGGHVAVDEEDEDEDESEYEDEDQDDENQRAENIQKQEEKGIDNVPHNRVLEFHTEDDAISIRISQDSFDDELG